MNKIRTLEKKVKKLQKRITVCERQSKYRAYRESLVRDFYKSKNITIIPVLSEEKIIELIEKSADGKHLTRNAELKTRIRIIQQQLVAMQLSLIQHPQMTCFNENEVDYSRLIQKLKDLSNKNIEEAEKPLL